jgi:hypothetical protein
VDRLEELELRVRRLEETVRSMMNPAPPPGRTAVAAVAGPLAGVPTSGGEIIRLREELQQVRTQLEAARRRAMELERQVEEQKKEHASPWEGTVAEVRRQARQVAGALCDQIWTRKLEPRRVQLDAERERLTQMEPVLTKLRDGLQAVRQKAPDVADPLLSTVIGLKNGVAGTREVLNQYSGRRFETMLPEPEVPRPDWDARSAFAPAAGGGLGRVSLSGAVQAWESEVSVALDLYLQQCLREVENAAAALDQHLGKGPALQVQDRITNIYTMLYHAQSSNPKLQPVLEPLELSARILVEAAGLTVIMPQVGRNFDVYLQDFLDYDSASDLPADTVSRVVEPGFKKDGKPLVKAKVLVSGKRG